MPNAMILRPSVIFGQEDGFFNRFAGMSRMGPVLPVVGADTKFQPVYVDDVAQAVELGVTGAAAGGVYELGGPDVRTFRALMEQMLDIVRRRRAVLNIPFFAAKAMALMFDVVHFVSFGLVPAQITRDQVKTLRHDNIVSGDAKTFADLGIEPEAMDAILPEYLWRFRPSGQYDEIKESARNLQV